MRLPEPPRFAPWAARMPVDARLAVRDKLLKTSPVRRAHREADAVSDFRRLTDLLRLGLVVRDGTLAYVLGSANAWMKSVVGSRNETALAAR